jgi:hypothetical protein
MPHGQALAVDGDGQVGAAVMHSGLVKVVQGAIHAGLMDVASFGKIRDTESGWQFDIHVPSFAQNAKCAMVFVTVLKVSQYL